MYYLKMLSLAFFTPKKGCQQIFGIDILILKLIDETTGTARLSAIGICNCNQSYKNIEINLYFLIDTCFN